MVPLGSRDLLGLPVEFTRIASKDELEPAGRLSVVIDDYPALLIRDGDNFYAIEDVCSHDGQPLTVGPIENCEITCPRHGARFDIKTGNALCMPAIEGIQTFEIEIRDGEIFARASD